MSAYREPPESWDCRIVLSSVKRSGEPYSESFELELDEPIEHWGQSYTADGPIAATLDANYTGERIMAKITVSGGFILPCSRCLADARVAIFGELRYLFSLRSPLQEPTDEDDEDDDGEVGVIFVDSFQGELDLREEVWETLLLSLPEGALCREDCKGLCPVCGADLNEGACSCVPDTADPRFAVLRGLIDDEKN